MEYSIDRCCDHTFFPLLMSPLTLGPQRAIGMRRMTYFWGPYRVMRRIGEVNYEIESPASGK